MAGYAYLIAADVDEGEDTLNAAVRDLILSTAVLQRSGCRAEVRAGRVPPESHARFPEERVATIGQIVLAAPWSRTELNRLQIAARYAGIYGWTLTELPEPLAKDLHIALRRHPSYFGALTVDVANPLHRLYLRDFLEPRYQFEGTRCTMLRPTAATADEAAALSRHGYVVDGLPVAPRDPGRINTLFLSRN